MKGNEIICVLDENLKPNTSCKFKVEFTVLPPRTPISNNEDDRIRNEILIFGGTIETDGTKSGAEMTIPINYTR